MRKKTVVWIPFLLVTIILSAKNVYAQKKALKKEAVVHNQKYFLRLEQNYFTEILKIASVQLEKENTIVKKLSARNDSLLSSGNIYDSVSVTIKNQLTGHLSRIDSLNAEILKFQQKIVPFDLFRRQYSVLQPRIIAFKNLINNNAPLNEFTFRRVNEQLDSANISGEKGRLKGILNSAAAQQQKESAKISEIGTKKDSLLISGKVDATVAVKIDTRLQMYQRRLDSITKEIVALEQKINSPKEFTKDFKFIKTRIILIDSVVNKNASAREYIFKMIDESLVKSKRNLFNLAAFFGPGGFIIPKNKYSLARNYFSPIIDSLVKFSNNYSSVYRTASVIVNGYADATSIGSGSTLYNVLSTYLNNTNPSKSELNSALSALRAEEISKLLNKILKERFPDFKSIDKVVFETVEKGLGEQLPEPTIKNYTVRDDRRRVVVIFWSILPIE
jgi:hypothetical protein